MTTEQITKVRRCAAILLILELGKVLFSVKVYKKSEFAIAYAGIPEYSVQGLRMTIPSLLSSEPVVRIISH